jgi:hypothetical protein
MENETKICKCCGEPKPIDAFRLYKGKTRLNKCIACEKEYMKNHKTTPRTEKIVVKKSAKVMPVQPIHVETKPSYLNSYEIKGIIVDTTPKPNARQFAFEGGPTLYVPSGVSIIEMINSNVVEMEEEL